MVEPKYDTSRPALVTGATGYVAGYLVKRLLEEGFTVHGTVRDPANEAKTAHLRALAEGAPGTLRLFAADLLEPGSFDEAMAGCAVVFHTASPFIAKFDDAQRDLITPAVEGTKNVLETASRTEGVERVVVTSSCAAVAGGPKDIESAPGGVLDESCWNTMSTLTVRPYAYSKTLAERTAWELAEAQSRWRLVVVNPALVLGPSLANSPTSASFDHVRKLADGTYAKGAPPFELGMVDVRDVAECHLRAGFVPEAEGRHINFSEVHDLASLAEILRERHGDRFDFPPPADPDRPRYWKGNNAKSQTALGLTYRPIAPALLDMFDQLIAKGVLTPRG